MLALITYNQVFHLPENNSTLPLCVDLDGSLIKTDMGFESVVKLIKTNPLYLFNLFFWLFLGKAKLKWEIGKRIELKGKNLPFNNEVLDFLKNQSRKRDLYLVTGTITPYALEIQKSLGLFKEVFATTEQINLTGKNKANLLVKKFGDKQFAYLGNSRCDLKVWKHAGESLVVSNSKSLIKKAQKLAPLVKSFKANNKPALFTFLKAIRIHQWVKNILIFGPIVLAHEFTQMDYLKTTILAFFSFSFMASSVYLINDLLDLEADRGHHSKKNRPLAAGELSIPSAILSALFFVLTSFSIGLLVSTNYLFVLTTYAVLTLSYSLLLKNTLVLDVVLLAILYTIRILAGAHATGIYLSPWLKAFSLFFFLGLAFLKRFIEVKAKADQNQSKLKGRKYTAEDLPQLSSLGSSSGFLSIVVLSLYVYQNENNALYSSPEYLWGLCIILLYWKARLWILAGRGQLHDDPVIFALRDRVSLFCGLCMMVVLVLAK